MQKKNTRNIGKISKHVSLFWHDMTHPSQEKQKSKGGIPKRDWRYMQKENMFKCVSAFVCRWRCREQVHVKHVRIGINAWSVSSGLGAQRMSKSRDHCDQSMSN